MENYCENFARSMKDPDKMLEYINIGLTYISACNMQIHVDNLRKELGMITENEYRKSVNFSMKQIVYEVMDIKIYTSSEPFKNKFLKATNADTNSKLESIKNLYSWPDFNLSSEIIDKGLEKLLCEIREFVNYKEDKTF